MCVIKKPNQKQCAVMCVYSGYNYKCENLSQTEIRAFENSNTPFVYKSCASITRNERMMEKEQQPKVHNATDGEIQQKCDQQQKAHQHKQSNGQQDLSQVRPV